jgi:hypothetical protein
MSIFSKLFGTPEPAPDCEVDPVDALLVDTDDERWWASLSRPDLERLEKSDNVFKVALYTKFIEKDGMSKASAISQMKKSFPVYYLRLADREAGDGFTGRDAKLPYVLKNRVNRFVHNVLATEQHLLAKSTSFNALVRTMIESGRM